MYNVITMPLIENKLYVIYLFILNVRQFKASENYFVNQYFEFGPAIYHISLNSACLCFSFAEIITNPAMNDFPFYYENDEHVGAPQWQMEQQIVPR